MIDCFLNKNCGGVGGCVGTVITENNFAFNIELGIKYYILLLLTIFLYWKKKICKFLNYLINLSH